jgi:PAS domain-containing protein
MPVRDAHESAVAEPDYRRLLESVNAIVWRADPRTFQTTYASRVAVTLLGYPLEMWTEVPNFWIEHVHPDDRARVMEISSTARGALTISSTG